MSKYFWGTVKYIYIFFSQPHVIKAYTGSGCIAPYILNLRPDEDEWSDLFLGRFTPLKITHSPTDKGLDGPHIRSVYDRTFQKPCKES
jgi:hypothetical protein